MTLGDRVVVMSGGHIQQAGTPLEVYRNPTNRFVAGFIGSPPTNFMDPALLGQSGGGQVGVRPEHVRLTGTGKVTARVAYAEALGAETLVHLRAPDGTQLTVRQDAGKPIPQEGTEATLDWDDIAEMRFDAAGQRI